MNWNETNNNSVYNSTINENNAYTSNSIVINNNNHGNSDLNSINNNNNNSNRNRNINNDNRNVINSHNRINQEKFYSYPSKIARETKMKKLERRLSNDMRPTRDELFDRGIFKTHPQQVNF